jgi:hypothetical protein
LKKSNIVKHFLQEVFIRKTIYNIIKRYEIGLPVKDLPRNGRSTFFREKNQKAPE